MADFATKTGVSGTVVPNTYDSTPALTDRVPLTGKKEASIQDILDSIDDLSGSVALASVAGVTAAGEVNKRTLADLTTDLLATSGVPAAIGSVITYQPLGTGADATTIQNKLRQYPSILDFEPTAGTGSDDAAAFTLASGQTVYVPPGNYLIQSSVACAPNTRFIGAGENATVITVKNTTGVPAFYGFAIADDNVMFQNLKFVSDKNGETWCAAVGFTGNSDNTKFKDVTFSAATKAGNWGVTIQNNSPNVNKNAIFDTVVFSGLEQGVTKANANTSTQIGWRFINVTGYDCTDCLNINSPLGEWSNGYISGRFTEMDQFAVAFAGAGCHNWNINAIFNDCDLEALHCEAECYDISAEIYTKNVNRVAGVVGSSGSDNGAVQVITGARNIKISGHIDLTANTGGSPNGVVCQNGAGASTGLVEVSATISCESGNVPIIASDSAEVDVTGMRIVNSGATTLIKASSGSVVTGRYGVRNPTTLATIASAGACHVTPILTGDLSLQAWSNASAGRERGFFDNPIIIVEIDANVGADWQDVCAVPVEFVGKIYAKFSPAADAGAAFMSVLDVSIAASVLTINSVTNYAGGNTDPAPSPPDWRVNAGRLQTRAFRATTISGPLTVRFVGIVIG